MLNAVPFQLPLQIFRNLRNSSQTSFSVNESQILNTRNAGGNGHTRTALLFIFTKESISMKLR